MKQNLEVEFLKIEVRNTIIKILEVINLKNILFTINLRNILFENLSKNDLEKLEYAFIKSKVIQIKSFSINEDKNKFTLLITLDI